MFIHGKHTIASTPSETIKDLMTINGLNNEDLAKRLDMPIEEINTLLNDYYPMTDELAVKLHVVFGPAATFWKNLEKGFLEDKAKIENEI